ncbi:MAG TPA: carbohydrate-binding domain-containing protein [Fimbriiglobus sp.]|nr:carbohydrate-binding domain-containing protein [Fimbriiglobus sp.]
MLRRAVCATVVVALAVGVAAAEPIKLDLKEFKFKVKNEGTPEDLLGYNEGESKLFFYVHGTGTAAVQVPEDGEYTITIEASCDEANKMKAKIKVTVDETVVAKEFALKAVEAKEYPFAAKLKKGTRKLAIEFLNDEFKEGEYDLNLYVHSVKLEKKK